MSTVSPRGRRRRCALSDGPDPVDIHGGRRVKLRRILLGLTQADLATALDLAFQQVQKYERGSNRISTSTLHRIAVALDVPVSFFFDDMADGAPPGHSALTSRESLEVMRYYHGLPETLRRQVHDLLKAMARDGE